MFKLTLSLQVLLVFVAAASSYQIIHPTYRPPPTRGPVIRTAREVRVEHPSWLFEEDRVKRDAGDDEPPWLYNGDDIPRAPATGDNPYLPSIIDDVRMDNDRRHARSVDSPSARRGGGSHSTSSGSRDTGATPPGYNRRNARSIRTFVPLNPSPTFHRPSNPFDPNPRPPRPYRPIYARSKRSENKPKHGVVIPGWNPHANQKPWQVINHKF